MRIIKRARARADLVRVWVYSRETWGETQADKYVDQIELAIERLASNPELGPDCDWVREGYRRLRVNHHLIYYRIRSDFIEVVRILHERMDQQRHL